MFELKPKTMNVQHERTGTKGEFYIEEQGHRIGSMAYVFAGDTRFIIEHTVVDPAHEGKGLGRKLVEAGVAFARENGYKIMPLCPYAKRVLEGSEVYRDILF